MESLTPTSRRLLWCIVFAGIVLQFVGLSLESFWIDELVSIWLSSADSVSALIDRMGPDVHPPLYQMLLRIWMKAVGDSEFATRLLSAIAGAAAILVAYFGLRRILGADYALIATALFAACYTTLLFGRTVRSYELLLLFSMLITVSWLAVVMRLKSGSGSLHRGEMVVLAISSILACATHFYGALLAGVCGIHLLVLSFTPAARPWRKAIWLCVVLTGACCLAVELGWLTLTGFLAIKPRGHFWIQPPDLIFVAKLVRVLAGTLLMALVVFPLIGWGLWRVFSRTWPKWPSPAAPAFELVLTPCLFVVLVSLTLAVSSSYVLPTVTGRNMLVIFPAFWIGVVALIQCSFDRKMGEKLLVGLACLALVSSVARLSAVLVSLDLAENEQPRGAVEFVSDRFAGAGPVELVASDPAGNGAFFYWRYYLDRSSLSVSGTTASNDPVVLQHAIENALAARRPLAVLIDPRRLYKTIESATDLGGCEVWEVQLTVALACRPNATR